MGLWAHSQVGPLRPHVSHPKSRLSLGTSAPSEHWTRSWHMISIPSMLAIVVAPALQATVLADVKCKQSQTLVKMVRTGFNQ